MDRRNFLRAGAALSLPLLSGAPLSASLTNGLRTLINPDSDRVLVLIQLNGGNDGLSTLVPVDQFDKLMRVRSNLMSPQDQLLNIDNNLAFHPSASGMHQIYHDGKMLAVQGVAYPNQNRSHFRSTDIWTSASDANELVTSGWMGRNFQADHPTFPEGFPNEETPHPFAVAMGNQVSQTCQGTGTNFSMAVTDPFNLLTLAGGGNTPIPDNFYGDELGFLRTSIVQANAYGAIVQTVAEQGQSQANYPDNRFASELKNVAQLISGGLKSKVYVVSLGGFDTHANQVVSGNPSDGVYSDLLRTLSEGLAAFHQDLRELELEDRVLSMTFSEFGRRIRSNQSLGSDHGTAAPLFLMGSCVQAGILGNNAEIGDSVTTDEGVAMQYDFRDVYGTVFQDWFELDPERVRELLSHDYVHLPILGGCDATSTEDNSPLANLQVKLWPNPTANNAQVSFSITGKDTVDMSISDPSGRLLKTVFKRKLSAGNHQFSLGIENYPAGVYFVRLQSGATVTTQRIVKR